MTITLRTREDVVDAVPKRLGQMPSESIVVLGIPYNDVRADLPCHPDVREEWRYITDAIVAPLVRERVNRAMVLVLTDRDAAPYAIGMSDLRADLARAGVHVVDLFQVRSDGPTDMEV